MRQVTKVALLLPMIAALFVTATPAHADWRDQRGGGWNNHGQHQQWQGHDRGGWGGRNIIGGLLLGAGAAAVLGSIYQAPPPVYYAPPPPVYYAPAPAYYAPPPVVYYTRRPYGW